MDFIAQIKQSFWVKLVLFVCGLVLLYLLLSKLKSVIIFFMISFIAAYIFDPVVDWMEAKKVPRTLGVAIIAIVILGGGTLTLLIAVPMFQKEIIHLGSDLPKYMDRFSESIIPYVERTFNVTVPRDYEGFAAKLRDNQDIIRKYAEKFSAPVMNVLSNMFGSIYAMIMSILGLIVIPVAWFYLLRDIDPIKAHLARLVPQRHKESVGEFFAEVNMQVSNFLRGQIVVCLILGLLYVIGLEFIVGVPLGVLIGVFAGFASIVPYLGLILGIVPALILALLEYGDWIHPLGVILVFAGAQALEGTIITPKVVGDSLGLHPVTIIFAILIWGELMGFVGILIAVPATAIFMVALKRIMAKYFISRFYLGPGDKGKSSGLI